MFRYSYSYSAKFGLNVVSIFVLICWIRLAKANFEDNRCRCICPSTEFFTQKNKTSDDTYRRYYTKTGIHPETCNSQTVVKEAVYSVVDSHRLDAFLANCNCKFESRNSTLLWIVVLFVIFIMLVLGSYTGYLVLLDPVLRRQRQFIPYRRQGDDVGFSNIYWFRDSQSVMSDDSLDTMEENIFANPISPSPQSSEESEGNVLPSFEISVPTSSMQMRPRMILGKVEAEQNKWKNNVEEQRRNVLQNHTMLN